MLLQEAREISHLLLQGGDLALQGVKPLGQCQERSRQGWHLAGNGRR